MKRGDLDTAIELCAQGKAFEAWGELTALKIQWDIERASRKRPPSMATMLERVAQKLRNEKKRK